MKIRGPRYTSVPNLDSLSLEYLCAFIARYRQPYRADIVKMFGTDNAKNRTVLRNLVDYAILRRTAAEGAIDSAILIARAEEHFDLLPDNVRWRESGNPPPLNKPARPPRQCPSLAQVPNLDSYDAEQLTLFLARYRVANRTDVRRMLGDYDRSSVLVVDWLAEYAQMRLRLLKYPESRHIAAKLESIYTAIPKHWRWEK